MEQDFTKQEIPSFKHGMFRLGKIKNKYLIIQIVCWSDTLDECVPLFIQSCRIFKNLFENETMSFMLYGSSWEYLAIPKEPAGALISTHKDIRLISKGLKYKHFKLELVYNSSKDVKLPEKFHAKCEGVTNIVCVIQTDMKQIIGGYTQEAWEPCEPSQYKSDPHAFIFSLSKQSLHPIQHGHEKFATFHDKNSFCVFGDVRRSDLFVGGWNSVSNLGTTYTLPEGIMKNSFEASSYLAGNQYFNKTVIQAYKVVFI
ncbi:hypothetical protein FGO68_gene9882 [Halteria grandinella]|uniref:TLDc domain-containing protein n=1 Tax=Halteria grandinella TaxID=5974 RepID=A0A8J8SYX0_HALGN|nr:hypothetical protein FGO68_gene9882 [Halteria grandinella]